MADLKAFRKANKLTQEQVAEYLGIKKPFICKIETGRESFPEKHLRKLLANPHGWDISALAVVSETLDFGSCATEAVAAETQPADAPADVVVISQQVLEEMSAQRQLAEQALAVAQDQLAVTNEALLNAQRNLAHEQQQVTAEQQQVTAEQQQVTTSQAHLTVEQQQTSAALEEAKQSRKQVDELLIMLKNSELKLERELDKMLRRINELENKRLEHDDEREHKPNAHKNDA